MEIKLGDEKILALGDLVMPPTELVVIGAGLKSLSLSHVECRIPWAIVNRQLDVWA